MKRLPRYQPRLEPLDPRLPWRLWDHEAGDDVRRPSGLLFAQSYRFGTAEQALAFGKRLESADRARVAA